MANALDDIKMSHEDYRVGWICALPCEMAAAICMLDEQHQRLPQPETDHNNYTFGRIGDHNVVIACLPYGVMGTTSAARVAASMRSTFRKLRFGLLVGIGGGAPSEEHDIRLGDVVVSRPEGAFGGVIQYDFGKTMQEGRFVQTGSLNRPPDILLNATAAVQARYQLEGSHIPEIICSSVIRYPRRGSVCQYPGHESDQLFHWEYDHPKPKDWSSEIPTQNVSCDACDKAWLLERPTAHVLEPNVHYGLVASGNQVIRDGRTRERLRRQKGILCFEMEAAGIVDEFPCLVIRGICDYADSHKNKTWQNYAATTAAAYASELLSVVPASQLSTEHVPKSFAISTQRKFLAGGSDREYRDDQDETLLQSLAFEGMFSRRNNIERRHPKTCTWILEHEFFVKWLQGNHGLLWIKGIPGAGKSTLMSFLYDYFKKLAQQDTLRLDFFFNARGFDLQKRFIGLLRSMIHQLFEVDESIRPKVRRLFLEKMSEAHNIIEAIVWQQPELESLLSEIVEMSAQSRKILLFVDALDEAGTAFARQIASYFHQLNETTSSQEGGTEIIVEDYNSTDIEKFILENLPLSYLLGPSPDDMRIWRELQLDLVRKASGSFQWARLIVPLVEKHITDGRSARQIHDILRQVPKALNEAYSHVLTHVIDVEDWPNAFLLFSWVCLAQRPLNIIELGHAMASRNLHMQNARIRLDQLESFVNSPNQMGRQVRALSGGLLRVVRQLNESKVEPVHQSVTDFMVAGGIRILSGEPGGYVGSISDNVFERSHSMMFRTCLNYMQIEGLDIVLQDAKKVASVEQQLINIVDKTYEQTYYLRSDKFGPEPGTNNDMGARLRDLRAQENRQLQRAIATCSDVFNRWPHLKKFERSQAIKYLGDRREYSLKTFRSFSIPSRKLEVVSDLIDTQVPFLWYALSNLLVHAEELPEEYFVSNTADIEDFASLFDRWRLGHKVLNNSNNDHDHPNSGTTLLHVAAAANATFLAKYCLAKEMTTNIDNVDAGGNTALHLAISARLADMVDFLLLAKPNVLIRNKDNLTPLAIAFRVSCIPAATSIIRYCSGNALHTKELERMLGVAALTDSDSLVRLLINAGVQVNAHGVNALYKAAKYGHLRTVFVLLEAGADINTMTGVHDGPLQIACSNGHAKVVELLLERRAYIHYENLRASLAMARFNDRTNVITVFERFGIG